MITKEEIRKFRIDNNLTQEEFAEKLSISREMLGLIERGKKNISAATEAKFELLRINFSSNDNKDRKQDNSLNIVKTKNGLEYEELPDGSYLVTVDLIPFEAHARYISDEVDLIGEWEKITFTVKKIGRGKYKAFRHKGYSMFNEDNPGYYDVNNGDVSLCRELGRQHWKDGFDSKRAPYGWVIVTTKNIIHKDITHFDIAKGTIICHSRNPSPEYMDFEWSLNEVREINKIVQVNHN